jgi:hypothetical protein
VYRLTHTLMLNHMITKDHESKRGANNDNRGGDGSDSDNGGGDGSDSDDDTDDSDSDAGKDKVTPESFVENGVPPQSLTPRDDCIVSNSLALVVLILLTLISLITRIILITLITLPQTAQTEGCDSETYVSLPTHSNTCVISLNVYPVYPVRLLSPPLMKPTL